MNLTLKYLTDSTTVKKITVKDYSFKWLEVFWDDDSVSITGSKRNNHRGYQGVLELQFENNDQLKTVAKEIYDTLLSGAINYSTDQGDLNVVPESYESIDDYINQIRFQPSTLVLEGDIVEKRQFTITGILCGNTDVTCGQTDVLCGA